MKTLCLVAMLFFCQMLFGQIDLESGLVAYYPFSGNAQDESSFENDATTIFEASLTEGKNGEADEAFTFDGIDDHIIIPHADQINFNNQQAFTISIWVKIPEEQTDGEGGDIISKWTNSGTQPYPFVLRVFNQNSELNGQVRAIIFTGELPGCSAPTAIALNSTTAVNDNNWHHIIFSRSDNGILQLYVDCQLEATAEDNTNCTTENNADLYIGLRVPNPPFRTFTGSLDEFRIYDRSLNMDEINSVCTLVSSHDLDNTGAENLVIFPNPLKSGTALQTIISEDLSIQAITVFGPNGQKIGTFDITEKLNLPAGSYTVQFSFEKREKQLVRKLVVIE